MSEFILPTPNLVIICFIYHKQGNEIKEVNLSRAELILTNRYSIQMLQIRVLMPKGDANPMHEEAEAGVTPVKF